jgi:chromosome segregation ATPase
MSTDMENIESGFQRLETAVSSARSKIEGLKRTNKELKSEVNELKRLLALSEKKAERMKFELDDLKSNGQQSWKAKEKDIKQRLQRLSAKIIAFENNHSFES